VCDPTVSALARALIETVTAAVLPAASAPPPGETSTHPAVLDACQARVEPPVFRSV
jgi:hypothetical protein